MRIFDDEFHTHMPFVFEGTLLHCKAQDRVIPIELRDGGGGRYQPYDIYVSDLNGKNSQYIGSELGEEMIACSPNAYRAANGEIVLNYVATLMPTKKRHYLHYQRRGQSLRTLGPKQIVPEREGLPVICQSENARFAYTVHQRAERSALIRYDKTKSGADRAWRFGNLAELKRAMVLDDTSVVLTYTSSSSEVKSAIFDTANGAIQDIKVNGQDIYKSHVHGDQVYHAVRSDPGIDIRDYGMTIECDAYTLEPSCLTPVSLTG
jgi:hypothetical protein